MTDLDTRAQVVLNRLLDGPASTVELQQLTGIVHAPKQILDLRRAGHTITRRRLPSGIAIYSMGAPVGAGSVKEPRSSATPAPSRAPEFGDPDLIRSMRPKRRRR
ncbi:MAG TPA: helix-turn-helix domain-containing protein [Candidatus Limnocylindrales bacterium]|nr:helix-turn-helix domain-containing protein [Candidatus Limnocylindrales bacterium]